MINPNLVILVYCPNSTCSVYHVAETINVVVSPQGTVHSTHIDPLLERRENRCRCGSKLTVGSLVHSLPKFGCTITKLRRKYDIQE